MAEDIIDDDQFSKDAQHTVQPILTPSVEDAQHTAQPILAPSVKILCVSHSPLSR